MDKCLCTVYWPGHICNSCFPGITKMFSHLWCLLSSLNFITSLPPFLKRQNCPLFQKLSFSSIIYCEVKGPCFFTLQHKLRRILEILLVLFHKIHRDRVPRLVIVIRGMKQHTVHSNVLYIRGGLLLHTRPLSSVHYTVGQQFKMEKQDLECISEKGAPP